MTGATGIAVPGVEVLSGVLRLIASLTAVWIIVFNIAISMAGALEAGAAGLLTTGGTAVGAAGASSLGSLGFPGLFLVLLRGCFGAIPIHPSIPSH